MEYITIILLLITTLLLYRLNYYKEKYQIYYNNYKQCLLALQEIENKNYYDNDFQDWEILVSIGTDKEDIYDITIYYAKTRINENIIVETNFEEV